MGECPHADDHTDGRIVRTVLPLSVLVTSHGNMASVIDSGRKSDTPDAPILVSPRADMPGRYEIRDGHHRVADALANGYTDITAVIDPVPDDEHYDPPFYPFDVGT